MCRTETGALKNEAKSEVMSLFKKKVTKDCATCRGFTLVELMVVIAIVVFGMAIAIPNINAWKASGLFNAAARDLRSSFQLAKMEAAKNNVVCTITFNLAVGSYDVYVDTDEDLVFDDPGELRLNSVVFSDYKGVSLGAVTFAGNGFGDPSVAFNSRGLPIASGGGPGGGTVTLSDNYGRTRTITVTAAGCASIN